MVLSHIFISNLFYHFYIKKMNMNQSFVLRNQSLWHETTNINQDINILKAMNKELRQEFKESQRRSNKKILDINQGYEEVVKLISQFYVQLNKRNLLSSNKNITSSKIFSGNQYMVKHIEEENNKLKNIFQLQNENVDRLIQSNQAVVNQELTQLCRRQEQIIDHQISNQQKLNNTMKEQANQVKEALLAMSKFQDRNTALEEKLLEQKEQIQGYMKIIRRENQTTISDIISSKIEQANEKHRQYLQKAKQMMEEMEKHKNQILEVKQHSQSLCSEQEKILNLSKQQNQKLEEVQLQIKKKQTQLQLFISSCSSIQTKFDNRIDNVQKKFFILIQTLDKQMRLIKQDLLILIQYMNKIEQIFEKLIKSEGRREKIKFGLHVIGGVARIVRIFV